MPVHKSGSGWKWGKSGKLYKGSGAKSRAEAQARAIYASGYREEARRNIEEATGIRRKKKRK